MLNVIRIIEEKIIVNILKTKVDHERKLLDVVECNFCIANYESKQPFGKKKLL